MTGLRLSNIGKSYGKSRVLSGIDLDIAEGEFVAVLGPSGCGKTTLLRLVAGFDRPDDGTIALADRQVAGGNVMEPPERRGIGIVFQNHAPWPHMSVAENVGYALKMARLPRQLYRAPADATVAGFIGGGLVLPVKGLRPVGGGLAAADPLGTRARLRCHAGEIARPLAMTSTHPAVIQPARPGEPGIPACVVARSYRGGSWSCALRPETDPSLRLPMVLPDTAALPEPGAPPGTSVPGAAPTSSSHLTKQFQCAGLLPHLP